MQDYGLARFVNIGQKGGGNYLKENTTWAKQTIAHNTITQNETSHFEGEYEVGSQHHSELQFYDATNSDVQVVSAIEANAYPGTVMRRTMAVIKNEGLEKPFVLDILKVNSDKENQYDLPFYFMGQLIKVNFEYDSPSQLHALGQENGYQHLYLEGKGNAPAGSTQFSWMDNDRFYSLTSATGTSDELLFTRLGANDPEFNLRRDAAFMIRRNGASDTIFASVVEPHGSYSPVSESAVNSNSGIAALTVVHNDDDYTAVTIEDLEGRTSLFIMSNVDSSASSHHKVEIANILHRWTGPYHYVTENQ